MHIYAFGSVCRGEISLESDIDLLAIVQGHDERLKPAIFSIYSYGRVQTLWQEGNPFAWHLHLESRLLHAGDGRDFLVELGSPARYLGGAADCAKFRLLFEEAAAALEKSNSKVFELSTIFLAIRNLATCYSLMMGKPTFSRDAARRLGEQSLVVEPRAYSVLEKARLLSSRGLGSPPSPTDLAVVELEIPTIACWIEALATEANRC